jgi:hypothetical protein
VTIVSADNELVVESRAVTPSESPRYTLSWTAEPPVAETAENESVRVIDASSHAVAKAAWNLMIVPHPRSGFRKWFAKLESLTRLKEGWDSYSAPAPRQESIDAAGSYLSVLELLGWEPTRVEASVMGGVGVTHRQGDRKVYIEFYNDGRVHALLSDRTPKMETCPVGSDVASYYRFVTKAREYLNG